VIKKIVVESFKSLERVEVELGILNVFVGANGSGKSNFLEAIGVFSASSKTTSTLVGIRIMQVMRFLSTTR